jgi:hypothetical protein
MDFDSTGKVELQPIKRRKGTKKLALVSIIVFTIPMAFRGPRDFGEGAIETPNGVAVIVGSERAYRER